MEKPPPQRVQRAGKSSWGQRPIPLSYVFWTHEAQDQSWVGWANYYDQFELRDGRWWISRRHISMAGPVTLQDGWAGVQEPETVPEWA